MFQRKNYKRLVNTLFDLNYKSCSDIPLSELANNYLTQVTVNDETITAKLLRTIGKTMFNCVNIFTHHIYDFKSEHYMIHCYVNNEKFKLFIDDTATPNKLAIIPNDVKVTNCRCDILKVNIAQIIDKLYKQFAIIFKATMTVDFDMNDIEQINTLYSRLPEKSDELLKLVRITFDKKVSTFNMSPIHSELPAIILINNKLKINADFVNDVIYYQRVLKRIEECTE